VTEYCTIDCFLSGFDLYFFYTLFVIKLFDFHFEFLTSILNFDFHFKF